MKNESGENMLLPEAFLTRTLESHPQGKAVARILASAITAVAPDEAVRRFVRRDGGQLLVANKSGDFRNTRVYDLEKNRRVLIFGLGKAAEGMTGALAGLLADKSPHGLMVVKHPVASLPEGFEQVVGGHPVPTDGSLLAGQKLKAFLDGSDSADLLICLISGGGSALITLPHAGVALADMQNLTSALLGCGARIDEINTLRRHLDQVKGGGVAQMAAPAQVISLILSDVVGSPLEAIASGPTAPDPSSLAQALGILDKYGLRDKIPTAILQALQNGSETPKPGSPVFERVQNVIVGDNWLATQAALQQARLEGFEPIYLRGDLQGEARSAALELCDGLRSALLPRQPVTRPFCMVAGGETTVTLRGNGKGGRNQELALAAVNELADLPGSLLVSLATDGEDGPTDAAGAVVSADTRRLGLQAGLDPHDFLANNDAYSYFSILGDLLKPGTTGTNVNDLTFLFGF
jgi:hydroxypyruvate reductase